MVSETDADRLERYRIEGAVDFIGGIIKGAKERDDAGLLLCAENAEKALRCLRVDKATLRADLADQETTIARLRSVTVLDADTIATRILNEVMELPDRTSPDDWPEAMLVTGEELVAIVKGVLEELKRQWPGL